jgi:hypothetical protein
MAYVTMILLSLLNPLLVIFCHWLIALEICFLWFDPIG